MGQNFHTDFEYTDSINKGIRIQNSYPKGGQKYRDINGKEHVYVIFWTCITNQRTKGLELNIAFPNNSFPIPSSPSTKFQIYLPSKKMTVENESLFNYGLDLKAFLDENFDKPTELHTIISPNKSYLFYVVALSNQGVDGVVRAGFELHNRDLFFNINNHKISCGQIFSKD